MLHVSADLGVLYFNVKKNRGRSCGCTPGISETVQFGLLKGCRFGHTQKSSYRPPLTYVLGDVAVLSGSRLLQVAIHIPK